MRSQFAVCCGLALGLALGGCSAIDKPDAPISANVTDAPVGAGIEVPPGSKEDFIVNVGRRVYFDENSAELSAVTRATLDKQAEFLQRYPEWSVKIEGFADEKGSADYNKQLSQKRAEATRAYLVGKGIPIQRTRVKFFGNGELVKKCEDLTCWSQNRRAVTVLEGRTG